MAGAFWNEGPALTGLGADASAYEFFQLIRLAENGGVAGVPSSEVGGGQLASRESIRIRGTASLGFPSTAVLEAKVVRSAGPVPTKTLDVVVGLGGALGAVGELPWHYSEHVHRQASVRDSALEDFCDALHRRSFAFFYRAWKKSSVLHSAESGARRPGAHFTFSDLCAGLVGAFGLAERSPPEGLAVWLRQLGVFSRRQRSVAGLRSVLSSLTGCEVQVREFVGKWHSLGDADRTRLSSRSASSEANRLGDGAVLGARVWDLASGLHVTLGPVSAASSRSILDRGWLRDWLLPVIRSYTDHSMDVSMDVRLDPRTIEPCRIDGSFPLGQRTWLSSRDCDRFQDRIRVPVIG